MADIRALEDELNKMVLTGQGLEAFDKFYAEDVVMQENTDEPRRGFAANRQYEVGFFSNIAEFHEGKVLRTLVDGDRSASEWIFDCTFKDGTRMRSDQGTFRTWKNGKVVNERFYYRPNMTPAAKK